MKTINKYVGLDVYKDTPVVAVAEGYRLGEVRASDVIRTDIVFLVEKNR